MSKSNAKKIGIIGAINVDEIAFIDNEIIPYDSNNATRHLSVGGVGANIARNLNKLQHPTTLITAFSSSDVEGLWLIEQLKKEKLDIKNIACEKTSKFIAFCDQHNDLHLAINDMKAFENAMSIAKLSAYQAQIKAFDVLIVDANFSQAVLLYLIKEFPGPIYAEAISKTKVSRLKPILSKLQGLKLNEQEALSLLDKSEGSPKRLITELQTLGPKEILLTIGSKGAIIADETGIKTYPSITVKNAHTIGAGDAFFAGYLHGKLTDQAKALSALALTKLTLETKESVHPKLSLSLFNQTYKEFNHE